MSLWRTFVVALTLLIQINLVAGANDTTERNDAAAENENENGSSRDKKRPPPHILFVLIDDLGWGDVGYHNNPATTNTDSTKGSDSAEDKQQKLRQLRRQHEAQTPIMDRLATLEGVELHRHYVHHSCTGTRTSLQSGRFPVHVQTSLKNPDDPSSGMPRNLTGLAEHLKKNNTYATHYVGKWDVGMATPRHTPHGRGYDTSLNYFEHKNDFWTQECIQSACCRQHLQQQKKQKRQDDTETPDGGETSGKGETPIYDLWDTDKPARNLTGTDYEEFIFQRRMLDIIDQHAAAEEEQPLFLFYAPHVAHCPLQVPQSYLDQFDFIENDEGLCQKQTDNIVGPNSTAPPYSCRKQYHAMVKLLDDILGSLVDRLKERGMWENTVMVVTSDNGGPVSNVGESAATNYPLRGGKYSDWEGGVRSVAFVSGGYIPKERRGQVVRDPIHICDWYATLPALAGILVGEEESTKTDDKKVPPVDAVDVWSLIAGDRGKVSTDSTVPPRFEIPLSHSGLLQGDYKLLWNDKKKIGIAGWTYPTYPNADTKPDEIANQTVDCFHGCLFNVDKDPGEHDDIASVEPVRLQQMKKRLQELRLGFYENDERGVDSCPKGYNDDDSTLLCACWAAVNFYGGFLGPFQEVDRLAEASVSKYEVRI